MSEPKRPLTLAHLIVAFIAIAAGAIGVWLATSPPSH